MVLRISSGMAAGFIVSAVTNTVTARPRKQITRLTSPEADNPIDLACQLPMNRGSSKFYDGKVELKWIVRSYDFAKAQCDFRKGCANAMRASQLHPRALKHLNKEKLYGLDKPICKPRRISDGGGIRFAPPNTMRHRKLSSGRWNC
jgi:hypothetical protein